MLKEIASIVLDNVDGITRAWVDELRGTDRTEIHNQLLTAEIVNGMKATLASLADAIGAGESADNRSAPEVLIAPSVEPPVKPRPRSRGTAPLARPIQRALQAASSHGKIRHAQDFQIHEVIYEYVVLRQILWETIRANASPETHRRMAEVVPYIDRLLDELVLTTVESFYSASVRDLEKRAIRDPLTQLYNKEYFTQRLGEEMRRSLRTGDPLTIAMIDMDLLKEINDTYGHQAGDAVIVAVAHTIQETCRRSDVPCRYGGDEFAVILPETTKTQARFFAERVLRSVRNVSVPMRAANDKVAGTGTPSTSTTGKLPLMAPVPSVSMGIATFPEDARNPETLLAKADAALYRAKRGGKNRVSY
ncbi:MAG TPA: GGDEF domain-containing protein [Chloroflexia bacterium]|nr:GGDEF domain-containing protein [Chloroflexia bacterium]